MISDRRSVVRRSASSSLAAHRAEVDAGRRRWRLVGHREQPVDEVALAGVGRHPAGGGVRVREQAARLELGELGADRRRPQTNSGSAASVLDATGWPVAA